MFVNAATEAELRTLAKRASEESTCISAWIAESLHSQSTNDTQPLQFKTVEEQILFKIFVEASDNNTIIIE